MQIYLGVFIIIAGYLIGSIPTSIWAGKIFFSKDIREHGSGNAGATNAIRVLGPKVGVPVLLFDICKGFFVVKLISLTNIQPQTELFVIFQILAGTAVFIGHVFPLYEKFKGGKGVATLFGFFLAIIPLPTLITLGVFIITLLISKYVSLSSILAAFSFPLLIIFVFKIENIALIIFSLAVFILLLITHRKNIERLLNNEESKVGFLSNNKQSS